MGGDIGSFASGFSETLLKAQEQSRDREYKKALIEQSKLNTKLLENKVKLAEAEQATTQGIMPMIQQLMGGGQPQGQVAPGAGQPGMGQPGGGGFLSRLTPEQAFALDFLMKKGGDFDPKTREHAVPKWHGTPSEGMYSTHYGNIGGVIPPGQKFVQQEITNPDGSKSMMWVPQPPMQSPLFQGQQQPGGVQGGGGGPAPGSGVGPYGMQTAPPPQALPPKIPDAVNQYIATEIDPIESTLSDLAKTAKPEYFGFWNQLKAKGLDTSYLAGGIDALAKAGVVNVPPGFQEWHKRLWRIQNKEIHEFAGSAISAQELRRVLLQLATANTVEGFQAGVTASVKASQAYKDSVNAYYSKSPMERAKPSLGLGKSTNVTTQQAEQMLMQRGYKKDPQTGQWIK